MRDSHVSLMLATWRELDDDTRAHVEEHLAACDTCRAEHQAFQKQDAVLRNLPVAQPRYAWKQEVRERISAKPRMVRPRLSHQAGLVVALIVVFLAMSVSTVAVSAEALPGDFLYPVKRTVEQVNLIAIRDRDRETEYLRELAERRREEARRVLELERQVALQFDGVLQQNDEGLWTIDDIPVQIDSGAMADAGIEPGDMVQIDGLATSGEMKVLRITKRHQHRQPAPPAEATPTPTGTPTAEPVTPPTDQEPAPHVEETSAPTVTGTAIVHSTPTKEWTATRTPAQNDQTTQTPVPPQISPGNKPTITATPIRTRTPNVGIVATVSRTVTPHPTRTPRPTRTRPSTWPGATFTITPRPTHTRPSTWPGATRTRPAHTPAPTVTATPGNTDPSITPGVRPSRTRVPPATPTRPPANDIPTATPVQPGIRPTPVNSSPPTATPVKPAEDTPPASRETPTPPPTPPSIAPGIGPTPTPEK